MAAYKLIIFDLDGTLLNTIDDLANSCNQMLETLNFPTHTVEDYKLKVGNGARNLVIQSLPIDMRNKDTIDRALNLFLDIYKQKNGENNKPYDGIISLLEKCCISESKIAVLSNKPQENVEDCISDYFPQIMFDQIVGAQENVPLKPDPTAIFKLLKTLNCNKDETVLIGDSDVDIETGQNADIDCIAVNWGFRPRQILERYKVQIVENTFELEKELGLI